MSADSYSACPQCAAKDPFLDNTNERDLTLREYHEFWWTDGNTFHVRYSGRCDDCGWSHSFTHQETVPVKDVINVR